MTVCRRAPANVLLVRPVLRAVRRRQGSFGLVVRAGDRPAFTAERGDRRGGNESEQLLGQHQPHQFVAEQPVVVVRSFQWWKFGDPYRPTQFENLVIQFAYPSLTARIAQPSVALHAARPR